jgi:hypothetical protein
MNKKNLSIVFPRYVENILRRKFFMQRDFKGVWIPREILAKYGVLTTAIVNVYYGLKISGNERVRLKKSKLLKPPDYSQEEIKSIISQKNFTGLGIGHYICDWCKIKTTSLHQHHYPIKKSNGGNSVVSICPNCHQEYHDLEGKMKLELIDGLQEIFNDVKASFSGGGL